MSETKTPLTDAVCITPIMGITVTEHKWEKLQELSRRLERDRALLIIHLEAWVGGCGDEAFVGKERAQTIIDGSSNLLRKLR